MTAPQLAVLREQIRRLEAIVRLCHAPLTRAAVEDVIEDLEELTRTTNTTTYTTRQDYDHVQKGHP